MMKGETRGMWIPLLLILIPGDVSGWGVTYGYQCALWGSTTVIKCSYDYPSFHIVTSVTWSKGKTVNGEWVKSVLKLGSGSFEYVGNYRGNCDLKIKNIRFTDGGRYYFSFRTTLSGWTSRKYASLSVKDLTAVLAPSTVTEGGDVSLTCRGCPTSSGFIWFKDEKPFEYLNFQASRESAARYRCALSSEKTTTSASVKLNVLYAPVNVVLRTSPSDAMVNGSSLTLSCSSDANPPVSQSGYSIYKNNFWISSGQSLTIPVLELGHTGQYHCQAWNNVSRDGEALVASADVVLDVTFSPVNISISVDPLNVVEGSGVNLTCSSEANPPAHRYTWYKQTSSNKFLPPIQVGSGQVLSLPSVEAADIARYLCQAGNLLGENNSTLMLLRISTRVSGNRSIWTLAGIGVCLLTITVLLLWYKRRSGAKKNPDTEDTTSTFIRDDPLNNVYANVAPFAQGRSNNAVAQWPRPHRKTRRSTSTEDDVTYTVVNFKPWYTRGRNIQKAQQQTLSQTSEDESVIYSNVASR